MAISDLSSLLVLIPGAPWPEATIEAAPGGITGEKAASWRECGINRVSLGVQSFVQRELARTGRKHNAEIVESEIAILRSAGINRINIDLIAGMPFQTRESWLESLDWIERLQPDHVSVYMLEVDEDSRLGLEILDNGTRYGASAVPADELVVELYETAVERLAALGIQRYEISNFARPGFESCHNLKYWLLEPYAGFGADAHGFDGKLRYQNAEEAAEYVRLMQSSRTARVEETAANETEERFFVGLRLSQGVRPRVDEWKRFDAPIRRFVDEGLLEVDAGIVRLTARGVLLSNEVFQEFLI
jgi:oxygen-independent coproporphyrinogen-3 oxidase